MESESNDDLKRQIIILKKNWSAVNKAGDSLNRQKTTMIW